MGFAQIPAVFVVLAVAVLCVGAIPRAIGVSWIVVGFALFVGTFGSILSAPQILPVALLTVVAVVIAAVGFAGFRRRDIETV